MKDDEYVNPNKGDVYRLDDYQRSTMTCILKAPDNNIKWPKKYEELGKRLEEFVPYGQAAALAESTFREEEAEEIAKTYERLLAQWDAMPDEPNDNSEKLYLHFFNCGGSGHWYMAQKPNKTTGDFAYGFCKIFEDIGYEFGSFVFNNPRFPKDDIMQVCPLLNVDIDFEPIDSKKFMARVKNELG